MSSMLTQLKILGASVPTLLGKVLEYKKKHCKVSKEKKQSSGTL